ncbi:VanZ family protein [Sulfurimonas sp. SAG-AH-194-L11]|nr:VanZ family protein [Sulfurimonas sp. SAG-AH-194-L11]MDF1877639.1 VanZ family protein [Sulfurimonas sp. SAG-AH-194-L11]
MLKILFFLCLVSIEYLATTSIQISVVSSMWDKSNHFIAFFTLFILLSLSFHQLKNLKKFFYLLGFGIQIEIVQEFIGRSAFSVLDIVADIVGIILGMIFYHFFKEILEKLVSNFMKI